MRTGSDEARATPTPELVNTEHHYVKSSPEGRTKTIFKIENLTQEATASQRAEQHNPSPFVQDTVPETRKDFSTEESVMEYEYTRKPLPTLHKCNENLWVTKESAATNRTSSQPQRTLHGANLGM